MSQEDSTGFIKVKEPSHITLIRTLEELAESPVLAPQYRAALKDSSLFIMLTVQTVIFGNSVVGTENATKDLLHKLEALGLMS